LRGPWRRTISDGPANPEGIDPCAQRCEPASYPLSHVSRTLNLETRLCLHIAKWHNLLVEASLRSLFERAGCTQGSSFLAPLALLGRIPSGFSPLGRGDPSSGSGPHRVWKTSWAPPLPPPGRARLSLSAPGSRCQIMSSRSGTDAPRHMDSGVTCSVFVVQLG